MWCISIDGLGLGKDWKSRTDMYHHNVCGFNLPTLISFSVKTKIGGELIAPGGVRCKLSWRTSKYKAPLSPVMEATLHKIAPSLDMFMDELPQMPRLYGYSSCDGLLLPENLTISMLAKKWVSFHFFFSHMLYAFMNINHWTQAWWWS